jgi:hypothetical protein
VKRDRALLPVSLAVGGREHGCAHRRRSFPVRRLSPRPPGRWAVPSGRKRRPSPRSDRLARARSAQPVARTAGRSRFKGRDHDHRVAPNDCRGQQPADTDLGTPPSGRSRAVRRELHPDGIRARLSLCGTSHAACRGHGFQYRASSARASRVSSGENAKCFVPRANARFTRSAAVIRFIGRAAAAHGDDLRSGRSDCTSCTP